MDLNRFFEALASQAPVPGGGSASCIAAAMATALLEMVVQLSIGRGNSEATDSQLKDILQKLQRAKPHLLQLAEKDAQGYQQVMEAFRLPKETEEEKEKRIRAIQKAFEGAISTPLTLMRETLNLITWNAFVLAHGNRNAFSDAGVAFHFIQVAFEGGKMNVLINLESLKDSEVKTSYLKEVSSIDKAFTIKKSEIEGQIENWIASIDG